MYYFRCNQRTAVKPNLHHKILLRENYVSFKRCLVTKASERVQLSVHDTRSGISGVWRFGLRRIQQEYSTRKQSLHLEHDQLPLPKHGFFDSNERFFASITKLPAGFFEDVGTIRSKSKEKHTYGIDGTRNNENAARHQENTADIHQTGKTSFLHQSAQSKDKDILLPLSDDFEASSFWPAEEHTVGIPATDGKQHNSKVESDAYVTDVHDHGEIAKVPVDFQDQWVHHVASRKGKANLSYRDAYRSEMLLENISIGSETSKPLPDAFRAKAGLRLLTRRVMYQISTQHQSSQEQEKEKHYASIQDDKLVQCFSDSDIEYLTRRQYHIGDVLSWAWILSAPSALSIRRFIAFSEWQEQNGGKAVPMFVPMQILRFKHIDARSFDLFLSETIRLTSSWSWRGSSTYLFIIRLLRHARQVNPKLFPVVTQLALKLVRHTEAEDQSKHAHDRLTHFLNRMLSLLALPSQIKPFRSMTFQQNSQLDLVRYMQTREPQIPINREGYRALSEVQLMHEKTDSEREWAQAKGPSWPPWAPLEQMGAIAKVDYSGEKSRVMKVLHRMQESGYSLRDADFAAQVLAGWDTDRSPTIQTRQLSNSPSSSRPWLPGNLVDYTKLPTRIWSARILSTRSIREAWMCFCSYIESIESKDRNVWVYHAMFRKLWASTTKRAGYLPGDGREVHPDPTFHRDLVYIPEAIPTSKQLYHRMRQDSIAPDYRLLSALLDRASSLQQAFRFIEDSRLPATTKIILQNKETVSSTTLKSAVANLPDYLLSSIMHVLCRRLEEEQDEFQYGFQNVTSSKDYNSPSSHHRRSSIDLALDLLTQSNCSRSLPWNSVLRGLRSHAYLTTRGSARYGLTQIWPYTCEVIQMMLTRQVILDLHSFREVAYIALQVETWLNPQKRLIQQSPLLLVNQLFSKAISINSKSTYSWKSILLDDKSSQIPSGDEVEIMLWCLGAQQSPKTIEDILEFLRWMSRNHTVLHNEARKIRRQAIVAARVFLDGIWTKAEAYQDHARYQRATKKQLNEAEKLCEPFEWATDEEVDEYLTLHKGRFRRIETKLLSHATNQ